jgi:tRNA modification GTPase
MDLIQARGERALAAAHQQLRGALAQRMNELVDGLLGVLARIEAYIDFPDEDLPLEDRSLVVREVERIAAQTNRLLATSHYGGLLRDGIKTVIIGAPNVGKSSLLNRLVGRERALVSSEPGTTRDFIEERIIVGPHCLRVIDTAGLNPSPSPLERLGMEKTVERAAEADLFLLVMDATCPGLQVPGEVLSRIRGDAAVVVPPSIRVSAAVATLVSRADSFQRELGGETIAVNARHAHALTEAREGLDRAHAKLLMSDAVELIASDLRTVLAAFGEITGKVDNERMLDQLFASFCIGK